MRARVAVAALGLQLAFGLVFAWGAVAPFVRSNEHWPAALVGLVFSATPLGYGPATIAGGRIADRMRPRPLAWTAAGLMALGFGVAFIWPGPWTFVGFYSFLALGIGGGLALSGALAFAVAAFPRHVGAAGGMLTATYALAGVIEVPVLAALAPRLGWLNAVRLVGGVLLVCVVAAVALLPDIPPPPRSEADRPVRLDRLVVRLPIWTALLVVILATPLGTYAVVNVGQYTAEIGLSAAAVALLAVVAGNGAGRVSAGLLADRAGVETILWLGCGCGAVGALLIFSAGTWAVVTGALLAGLTMGVLAGVLAKAGADAAPDAPNTAFGILFSGYAVGAVAGPLLGPFLGVRTVWLALGAGAVAAAGVLAFRRSARSRNDPTLAA